MNSQTLGLCDEVGFTWTSNASNRHRPEFHAYWSGSRRYAHHASAQSNLICGSLDLFKIPITVGIHEYYAASIRPSLDLRVESPPTVVGEGRVHRVWVTRQDSFVHTLLCLLRLVLCGGHSFQRVKRRHG